MVAEKNRVWRLVGTKATMRFNAWMKPRSSIWSASSRTRISSSRKRQSALVDEVEQAARSCHEDIEPARHFAHALAVGDAAEDDADRQFHELAVGARRSGDLGGELTRRGQHQHADLAGLEIFALGGEPVERRQHEGRGLAGAGLGDAEQVAPGQQRRDGLALDRRRRVVFGMRERIENGLREPESLKSH